MHLTDAIGVLEYAYPKGILNIILNEIHMFLEDASVIYPYDFY